MKGKIHFLLFFYIFLIEIYCESQEISKHKKIVPHFRKHVEEIEENVLQKKENPGNDVVTFMVDNLKEIFNDVDETAEIRPTKGTTVKYTKPKVPTSPFPSFPNNSNTEVSIARTSTILPSFAVNKLKNLPLTGLLDEENSVIPHSTNKRNSDEPKDKKNDKIKKGRKGMQKKLIANTSSDNVDSRRSCIMCDNIATEDCNDPKNKLIQSVICENEDDLCYSLHTPFGIVDRGCYSYHRNFSFYVCSCNLCNHFSIHDMPYKFTSTRDWMINVVELSRARNLRKSIFKVMSCLSCEVNTTLHTSEITDDVNDCLEGKIGSIPVSQCDQNEVCGVKALKADGYIYRGCVRAPLYNYWWHLCEHDLCNINPVVSLYDFV